jgi:chromate reductase
MGEVNMTKVAVLVGSLREESFTKKVAKNVMGLFPEEFELAIVPIGDLALYNQDFDDEGTPPQSWADFREKIKDCGAVLFVTPEYNRSVPGVLKNAMDVGSRPMADSVWKGKPAGVISNSPKNLSGFGANHHLRQSLVFFDMPVVQQPEVYLANVEDLLDVDGKINNESTVQFLQTFVDTFVELIKKYGD